MSSPKRSLRLERRCYSKFSDDRAAGAGQPAARGIHFTGVATGPCQPATTSPRASSRRRVARKRRQTAPGFSRNSLASIRTRCRNADHTEGAGALISRRRRGPTSGFDIVDGRAEYGIDGPTGASFDLRRTEVVRFLVTSGYTLSSQPRLRVSSSTGCTSSC